jgi:branched-subunit amino acid ABC-type transport system permease component
MGAQIRAGREIAAWPNRSGSNIGRLFTITFAFGSGMADLAAA